LATDQDPIDTDMRKAEQVDGKPVIDKINRMNMISLTIAL
jgi:hypothetical protein